MTERDREYELSVQALRAEAHPQVDKARVRARLVARGVLASAGAGAATATAAKATASWSAASVGKIVAGLTFLTMLTVAAVHYLAPAPAPRTRTLGHMLEGPLRAREAPSPAFTVQAAEKARVPVVQRLEKPPAAVHAPRATDPVLDLARENALISAAVSALRAGDGARASSLLDQHEREFPAGFLRAERETVRKRVGEAQRAGSPGP